jgi:hypothetical protein
LLALCWEGVGRLRVRTRPAEVRAFGFGDLPAEGEARLAGIERIFREECGRRLDRPAAELMESDVAELGEEAQSLYRLLVAARYGGGGELPEDRVQRWVFGR